MLNSVVKHRSIYKAQLCAKECQTRSFVIDKENKCFRKDNQFFRYISGEIDYFRVPRAYWKDRLHKMRMAGLNTIASYVEWSGHEPQPGKLNFVDNYDLVEFCKEAQREDLLVILRVGPYICGERDNGGFPSWLYKTIAPNKFRTTDKVFMDATEKWLGELLPRIKGTFYKNGGSVIALQVENEYGIQMCDSAYMPGVYNIFKKQVGDDAILFTADYWRKKDHNCGGVHGVPKAANMYTSDYVSTVQSQMDSINSQGCPLFLMELYTGWFLRWGDAHEKGTPSKFMDTFKELMRRNASVNIYMFHGGTNFGFSAPSREGSPLVTSYDYNAPLSEAGDPRDLYHKLRDIIKDFAPLPPGDVPVASTKLNIGVVNLTEGVSLMEVIDHFRANGWIKKYEQSIPMTFEDMGQDYGFVMYTAKGKEGLSRNPTLVASGIKDRAYVVTNGSIHALDSNHNRQILHFKEGETFAIRVFVENLGREFFKIGKDPKGITGRVTLNGHKVEGWTMEAVPVVENRDVSLVMQFLDNRSSPEVPGFFHGRFTLPPGEGIIRDTFLDPTGWKHGVAFINGIHLGRYWPRAGPQVTLYLPGAFMLPYPMENRLFLLEMESAPENKTVKLVDKHVLNGRV
ncbi:beta-galactosidase-1-like protein [Ixodes scapularis]|uniref:beta-galactosidase-1-like protein n=1 Tax=Ixodes scapularis TaxID=6945 RepID=UPI001A9FCE2A|nr:beta-galactosidase-1-like protein [Ixodes scapularis]